MDGVHMSYASDGLEAGGTRSHGAGETAGGAAAAMRGAQCAASALGRVAGAEALAAALAATRDAHVALSEQVTAAQTDLGRRAQTTAGTGVGLTGETTGIAGGAG